ncbi:MAG: hypothetical protein VX875_09720 [Pseudomonadota bacterium]|nr:hypothetical protein [Pseudomonadota bacterium]
MIRPNDATHQEPDGTYWKRADNGNWYFWQIGWGWSAYVGPVNKNFLETRVIVK